MLFKFLKKILTANKKQFLTSLSKKSIDKTSIAFTKKTIKKPSLFAILRFGIFENILPINFNKKPLNNNNCKNTFLHKFIFNKYNIPFEAHNFVLQYILIHGGKNYDIGLLDKLADEAMQAHALYLKSYKLTSNIPNIKIWTKEISLTKEKALAAK